MAAAARKRRALGLPRLQLRYMVSFVAAVLLLRHNLLERCAREPLAARRAARQDGRVRGRAHPGRPVGGLRDDGGGAHAESREPCALTRAARRRPAPCPSYRLYGGRGAAYSRGSPLGGSLFAVLPAEYRPVVGLSALETEEDHQSYMVDIGSTRNTFGKPRPKPAAAAAVSKPQFERHDPAASAAFFRYEHMRWRSPGGAAPVVDGLLRPGAGTTIRD